MKKEKITIKHKNLCEKINKSFDKYNRYCVKMSDFLEKCIIDFKKDELHCFYVDYMFGDGIILHIDCSESPLGACCFVNKIIEHFLLVGRKLTIKEVLEVSSI